MVPVIAFLFGAVMSFATGSSWGTFAIMMPLIIAVADALGAPMHVSIGAVLSGGMFGDHCSPISDTTVLSSAAAGCDHLQHVLTQLPYAGAVGAVSLLCCYIPAGLGLPILFTLPVAALLLYGLLRLAGSRLEESAER